MLIILNNMVLVTNYDSNSYLVLSAGDDHGIKGDDTNGSTPLRQPGRASIVTMTTEPNTDASSKQPHQIEQPYL